MHSGIKRFFTRSPREFFTLAQAVGAVVVARAGLWLLPLATVRRMMRWMLQADTPLAPATRCTEAQVIRAVVSAAKHSPIGSTCLAAGLAGQAMLQHHGYNAQLRIGVRRDATGKFAAHAWLERDGKVILGGPGPLVSTYTRLPEMEHLIQ